ncbi:MAG: TraR/DksA family transcriptional regulator [bacterium]|nr:TraR/DksA family transcriptional regulator [bacterium]
MEKSKLEQFKKRLEDEERRLLGEIKEGTAGSQDDNGHTVDFPQYGSKEDENAAEVASFTTTLSVNSALEKALKDVRSALKHITDGTYGICKYCQTPIPEPRLLARPESGSCISCKEKLKRS